MYEMGEGEGVIRRRLGILVGLSVVALIPLAPAAVSSPGPMHYAANEASSYRATHALGYNLHDTGTSRSVIDQLPSGDRALVWVGEKCPSGVSAGLKAAVSALAGDARVVGYYLADEPHVASCPTGPSNLAAEADYIHTHAKGQIAFITLVNTGRDYSAFAPARSHADQVGLDPYPCNRRWGCTYSHIDDHVRAAEAAGISQKVIVPIIQVFGDSYYQMPNSIQLQLILNEWAKLVPAPLFDYSYSWDCQSGALSSCLSSSSSAQSVMHMHNG
jgi:hypothetical protein